jgi:hypothetical protein
MSHWAHHLRPRMTLEKIPAFITEEFGKQIRGPGVH